MKIAIRRLDEAFHFVAANERGNEVHMDVAPAEGGQSAGAGPMQLLVMGLGGCSGIDILSMLKKGRHTVRDFGIELEAERAKDTVPAVFTHIHAHYKLEGEMTVEAVRRAIDLSLGKYCSVSRMLEKTARITYAFTLNGEYHRQQEDQAQQA